MPAIKNIIIGLLFFILSQSCIDRFYLDEFISNENKLVVEMHISDESPSQRIILSLTSSSESPEFIPYQGCNIRITDNNNNEYSLTENINEPGHYNGIISPDVFTPDSEFKLHIETPDGKVYGSSYESITKSPEIDSVYYNIVTQATEDPNYFLFGLQFSLDFYADAQYSNYYRYSLEETYEYHSTWPITAYLDNYELVILPTDYSLFTCYKTATLSDILLLSTENLTENTYVKFPLVFVSDQTQRLLYNYSLFIKQYALSKEAFEYWNSLSSNNKQEEGLFAKQPYTIKSNIYNTNDNDEHVIGYFQISSVTTKRITIKNGVKELEFNEVSKCMPSYPEKGYPQHPRPLYLVRMKHPSDPNAPEAWGYANSGCFDCTLLGGSVTKPNFFD